jgi:phosphopantetheinyl transferase
MPLYLHKQVGEDTVLAIWKIAESKEELMNLIGDHFHDSHPRHEHLHWLASRVVLRQLFPGHRIEISKDEFNKPSLTFDEKPFHISITHSHEYAAVIVSAVKTVSVDMERFDERIQRVKHKFMRGEELQFLDHRHEAEMLTAIWAAKETLYKYYGRKELDFKKNLIIEPFRFGETFIINGDIRKDDLNTSHIIRAEVIADYILTFIT